MPDTGTNELLRYVNQAVDDAAKKVVGAFGLIAGVAESALAGEQILHNTPSSWKGRI